MEKKSLYLQKKKPNSLIETENGVKKTINQIKFSILKREKNMYNKNGIIRTQDFSINNE